MTKSFSEYMAEKRGISTRAAALADKCQNIMSFGTIEESETSVKFIDVVMLEEVKLSGSRVLHKDSTIKAIEFQENGWVNVCEGDLGVVTYSFMNGMVPWEPNQWNKPNSTVVHTEAMVRIGEVIELVKKLSLEDAQHLKGILGPSLEERLLRTFIDAVVFDNPLASGQSNGV